MRLITDVRSTCAALFHAQRGRWFPLRSAVPKAKCRHDFDIFSRSRRNLRHSTFEMARS